MTRGVLGIAAALALALPALAEGVGVSHGQPAAPAPREAVIRVTINPEGRVSAALVGELPLPSARGIPIELGVAVVNQGYITGRLEARLVGDPPADAKIEFAPDPLTGAPREERTLRVTLAGSGPADVTIAFRLHSERPDLGGRDRVHMLLRCR